MFQEHAFQIRQNTECLNHRQLSAAVSVGILEDLFRPTADFALRKAALFRPLHVGLQVVLFYYVLHRFICLQKLEKSSHEHGAVSNDSNYTLTS